MMRSTDDEDREHIKKLRKEYKNLNRNIWNPFDKNQENNWLYYRQ